MMELVMRCVHSQHGGVLLAICILLEMGTASAQGSGRPLGIDEMGVTQLPAPPVSPGELPRPCPPGRERNVGAPVQDLRFDSDQARGELDPLARATLLTWARRQLRYVNDACMDMGYVVRKFQQATGAADTGVLTSADVTRLHQAMDVGRQTARQEAADLPRGVADFLPSPRAELSQGCSARIRTAAQQMRQMVSQRIMALPPQMRRSAVTEGIDREVKAQILAVAPQWADLWRQKPVLAEWARRHACAGDLRFMVEYWQEVMGVPANAQDTQAIARTLEWLSQAEAEQRQYAGEQDRRFAAEAQASGEAARARVWLLDDLSGKTRQQDVLDRMPPAFCHAAGRTVSCTRVGACTAEEVELKRARSGAEWARLATNPQSFQVAPGREQVFERLRVAESAQQRCQARRSYSAAAQSRMLFAGQEVEAVDLTFDEQGLATLRFSLVPSSDSERVRTLLTRRYGRVEIRQETRTAMDTAVAAGGPVYVPGVGTVDVPGQVVRVPVARSVTRSIWTTPQVRVEELDDFLFRFKN